MISSIRQFCARRPGTAIAALSVALPAAYYLHKRWREEQQSSSSDLPEAAITSRWVQVNGRRMHFLQSVGPSPSQTHPVVLLHGIISAYSFERVAQQVAPHAPVYVPDLPGIGESEMPATAPQMPDLANALVQWMDACGLDKVHLAAQSFGCNVAVEMAALHPERVASLTVQALTLEPERRGLLRLISHWLLTELRETPTGETKKRGQKKVPLASARALTKVLLNHAVEQRLPEVRCPTLVLHGTHDLIVSREWARHAAQLLPDGRLVEIPGATRAMNARQPQCYSSALLEFILPQAAPSDAHAHVAASSTMESPAVR